MKKTLFCLILAAALVLSSCFSRVGFEVTLPSAGTDNIKPPKDISSDGKYAIHDRDGGIGVSLRDPSGVTEIVIPAEVDGEIVRAFSCSPYEENTSVRRIILPDTITQISAENFRSLKNLEYNIYKNGKYLGTAENPYAYFLSLETKGAQSFELHPDALLIASSALQQETNLTSADLSGSLRLISNYAFSSCTSLKSVKFGHSLKEIKQSAFTKCTALTELKLPEGLELIGKYAFEGCTGLTEIELPGSLKTLPDRLFDGCTALLRPIFGEGIETIEASAFAGCSALREIDLPASLRVIREFAFSECQNLNNITVEPGIEYIHADSFPALRDALSPAPLYLGNAEDPHYYLISANDSEDFVLHKDTKSIAIAALNDSAGRRLTVSADPENTVFASSGNCIYERESGVIVCGIGTSVIPTDPEITSIGRHAFADCGSLTEIEIPSNIKVIGEFAFSNCPELRAVYFNEGLERIEGDAFSFCYLLSDVSLPDTLTEIGGRAFTFNSSLTRLTLPEGLMRLGAECFAVCEALEHVELSNCAVIENDAFRSCTALTEIELPETLRILGDHAFTQCSISQIELPQGLESFGRGVFSVNPIKSVSLPECKTCIEEYEFSAQDLTEIILHRNIADIEARAFVYCRSLKTVRYPGTRREWLAIPKSEHWNVGTNGFTVICSDGTITIPAIAEGEE